MASVTTSSLATQQAAPAGTGGVVTGMTVVNEAADAAATTGTAYSLQIGQRFVGNLATGGDSDWVAVNLEAGCTYVFSAFGTGGATAGIDDTVLRLMSASGQQLAINDDLNSAGGIDFSGIEFTAATTGRYFLNVSSFGGETGRYVIEAADPTFTLDQVVTQLTEVNWGVPVQVAFPVSAGGQLTVNIAGLTADGQRLAQLALDVWEYATGIDFVISTSSLAKITIDDARAGAFAGPSSFYLDTGEILRSDVNVSAAWLADYGRQVNTYSFFTFVHEIGHALGLSHPGTYDQSATFASNAYFLNDSWQMSVMSYFDGVANTVIDATDWIPLTPMIGDIAAMQSLYGTATTVNAGNTVWGVASNVGGTLGRIFDHVFDGVAADGVFWTAGAQARGIGFTIHDNGGTDLFDVSTHTGNQVIDLREEGVSSILGETGNVVIMRGSVIENAKTGIGHDRITGNDAANRIEGGAGNDTINGGAGSDTAVLAVNRAAVTAVTVAGGIQITSSLGTDVYSNIEFFAFADQTVAADSLFVNGPVARQGNATPDRMIGTAGIDLIYANAGNDTVYAGIGNDSIYGGTGDDAIGAEFGDDLIHGDDGDDTLSASDGNDTVMGGSGRDSIGGGNGNDSIEGGVGEDTIGAGSGHDILRGDGEDDVLSGGWGIDTVEGGTGNDTLAGSFDNDQVFGGIGDDAMGGGVGRDSMYGGAGNDNLGGGDDADLMFGEDGNDFLSGGTGNDTIYGEGGVDTLNGGTGNDELWGGAGADIFMFNLALVPDGGSDVIRDFEAGLDKVRIIGVTGAGQAGKFDALDAVQSGGNVVVTYGQQTVTLTGHSLATIDQNDFLFI